MHDFILHEEFEELLEDILYIEISTPDTINTDMIYDTQEDSATTLSSSPVTIPLGMLERLGTMDEERGRLLNDIIFNDVSKLVETANICKKKQIITRDDIHKAIQILGEDIVSLI